MNDRRKDKPETENVLTCEMLEEYLKELVLELNLHLLWEREEDSLFPPEKLLWIEDIAVTAYEAPQMDRKPKKYQDLARKMGHFLGVLWELGQMPYP